MPAETTHHVGGTKHFECRVKGHPRPEIRWYKDGQEITHISRYQFDHSHEGLVSMVIPNISHDDEGNYRCRADNSEGFASTSAYLFVRGHKEHPEEATTSFHAMQIEEAVFYTEQEKAARKQPKVTSTESRVIEEVNGDYQKKRKLVLEVEEVVHKSSTVSSSSSSTTTTTTTKTSSSSKKSGKESPEEESAKISVDMLEKSYHSSDEDDAESVRLRTISEKSETSVKESPADSIFDARSSLLMRQTKRLFSHDYGEGNDLLQLETSTVMETSSVSTRTTSVSATKTTVSSSGTVVEETSTSSALAASEKTRLKAGELDVVTDVTRSDSEKTRLKAGELDVVTDVTRSDSEKTRLKAGELDVVTDVTRSDSEKTRLKAGELDVATDVTRSASEKTRLKAGELDVATDVTRSDSEKTRLKAGEMDVATDVTRSDSEKTRLKAGEMDVATDGTRSASVSTATITHTTPVGNGQLPAEPSTLPPSTSQARSAAVEVAQVESSTSRSVTQVTENIHVTVEDSRSSRSLLKPTEAPTVSVAGSSTSVRQESEQDSSSFTQFDSGFLESSKSDHSQRLSFASDVSAGDVQADAASRPSAETEGRGVGTRETKDGRGMLSTSAEADGQSTRVSDEEHHRPDVCVEVESKKVARDEEEDETESATESDTGSVGSVVGVDVDLKTVQIQKLRKQESKEKDDAEEEAKLAAMATADSRRAEKDDVSGRRTVDAQEFVDDRKTPGLLERQKVDTDEADIDKKQISDYGKKTDDDKDKDDFDVPKQVNDEKYEAREKVRDVDSGKFVDAKKEDKVDDKFDDLSDVKESGDSVDSVRRRRTRGERQVDRQLEDDQINEGTVAQAGSWIQKVEEEKDKDKAEQKEIEDATSKGGDKGDETLLSEPRIPHRMEDTAVESGKTLKLRTQVTASPRPDVTWSKDGKVLREGGRITLVTEDDVYSLEIEELSETDAGTYRLRAVNSLGEVFSDVTVSVISAVPSSLAPGDRELSLTATVGMPQFVIQPQDVSVAQYETIKLTCQVAGDPAPKVSWEKDGQVVRSNRRVRVYESRGLYNLEIHDCEADDAGGYVCVAVNSRGQVTASVNVIIEGVERVMSVSEPAEAEGDLARPVEEAVVGATESSSDELFLKSYVVLTNYVDPDTKTAFTGGDIVEVLDSRQKSGMWLVRGKAEKDKVCFVPSSLLCTAGDVTEGKKKEEDTDEEEINQKKKERKTNYSPKFGSAEVDNDTSEDELRLRGVHPDYVAIADYTPAAGDGSSVRLSEGQIVEVIDMERPDFWLVKIRPTKTSPSRQGWVPSAYLEEKSVSAQFMRRSTRETFREEVLQVSNKQQEATLKRRYVLKEMEETEREYIKDLKFLVESYVKPITSQPDTVPGCVTDSTQVLFSNIQEILKFHDSQFLADIAECCAHPSAIGSVFLKWQCEFDNYIKFWGDRDAATFLLESDNIKTFFKEFSRRMSKSESVITSLLKKPIERLKLYQLLLKDVLRYAARAGEDCSQVEAAIAMLIALEKAVSNSKLLPLLEGFDGDLADLGHLIRHDDFLVWEGDVTGTRAKDRHVFLFEDMVVMTKKKKPELATDQTYFSYKASVDLSTIRIKESAGDDDRRFELWFLGDSAVEKLTLQARSSSAKQVWVKDIREALIKLGVTEPDQMPEVISDQLEDGQATPTSHSPLRQSSPTSSVPTEFGLTSDYYEESREDVIEEDLDSARPDAEGYESDASNYFTATEEEDGHGKPYFKHLLKNVICHEGNQTQVECCVGGKPTPSVTWHKGENLLTEGEGIQIRSEGDTSCLTFSEVKGNNSGTYTVTVSNRFGSTSSSFDLVVVEDLAETDTSTDRTSEEVTESGSETVVEDDEELSSTPKRQITGRTDEETVKKTEVTQQKSEQVEEVEEAVEDKGGEIHRGEVVEAQQDLSLEETTGRRRRNKQGEELLKQETQSEETAREKSDLTRPGVEEELISSRRVEEEFETGEEVVAKTRRKRPDRKSEREEELDVREEPGSESSPVVVEGDGQADAVDQALFFSADTRTSSSLVEDQDKDWALTASTQVTQSSIGKVETEHLAFNSRASVESSSFFGTEVTQSSLSFQTEISASENVDIFNLQAQGDTGPGSLASEGVSLRSGTSVSRSFVQAEVTQSSLSVHTEVSASETAFGLDTEGEEELVTPVSQVLSLKSHTSLDNSASAETESSQYLLSVDTEFTNSQHLRTQEEETDLLHTETSFDSSVHTEAGLPQSLLIAESDVSSSRVVQSVLDLQAQEETKADKLHPEAGLSLQTEASVDSSTFARPGGTQDLQLAADSDVSNSRSVDTVLDFAAQGESGLSVRSAASVDTSTYSQAHIAGDRLAFETGLLQSESVETSLDLTTPGGTDSATAEFYTEQEEDRQKATVEPVKEAAVEEQTLAEYTNVSEVQDGRKKDRAKPVEETPVVKAVVQEEQEEATFAFEEGTQEEQARLNQAAKDLQEQARLSQAAKDLEEQARLNQAAKDLQEQARLSQAAKDLEEQARLSQAAKDQEEQARLNQAAKDLEEQARLSQAAKDLQEQARLSQAAKDLEEQARLSQAAKDLEEQARLSQAAKDLEEQARLSQAAKDLQEQARLSQAAKDLEEQARLSEAAKDLEEQARLSQAAKDLEEQARLSQAAKDLEEQARLSQAAKDLQAAEATDTVPRDTKADGRRGSEPKEDFSKGKAEEATVQHKADAATVGDHSIRSPEQAGHSQVESPKESHKLASELQAEATFTNQPTDSPEEAAVQLHLDKPSLQSEPRKLQEQPDTGLRADLQPLVCAAEFPEAKADTAPVSESGSSLEGAAVPAKTGVRNTSLQAEAQQPVNNQADARFNQVSKPLEAAAEVPDTKVETPPVAEVTDREEKTRPTATKPRGEEEKYKQTEEKPAKSEESKEEKLLREERKPEKTKPEKLLPEETRVEEDKQKEDTHRPLAPRIEEMMDDCVTELGELARFDCRVSAYPDPEITWYKDGNKVTPSAKFELLNFHDDIFSLLIKKVDKADSGRYSCVAKNEYGEAKSEALLNVMGLKEKISDAHVAPSFVTKFYDIEVVEGVPVEFVCMIDGHPEPSVTWLLNGREVENTSEMLTRRQEDTVMLAFRSTKIEHSGEIICKLKNDSGQAMCKARLKVKEDLSKRGERPLFLEQPSDKEVDEGDEVTFECVISGLPEPEITWYFNGRELHESRRRTMRHRPGQKFTLTLKEVIPENAGVYTCKAVNRAGDASCAVELSVKELPTDQQLKGKFYDTSIPYDSTKYAFPPSFTRRIQDQRSMPGRLARFDALVIGVPEPEIEWQKDGFPLKWGSKYKMGREGNTAILVVENCEAADEGTYTCQLFNDAGKTSCSAQLRVQDDKWRQSLPKFVPSAKGVDLFRASPSPAPKKPVVREIPLEDKIPTMPIDKPVLLDVKPTSTKLSWMPAPTAMLPENAQKITYTIEARQLPSNQWVRLDSNIEATTHYVYGLKPDTEYQFRIKAENRFGTSEPTLPCTLKAREEPRRRESLLRETETPARPVLPKTRPYVSDIGKETLQLGWRPAEIPDYFGRSMSVPPVTYRVEAQKLPSEEWVPLASRVKKPSIYLSDLESDRDYNIRVRAQTPYGVSQPTEPVWIPRAKAFTGVPVSRPIITEIVEGTARLQWSRVDIPAFDSSDQPLLYMIEIQEPPSNRWRELARRVPTNYYIVRDLEPAQDYRFRVRAESRDGLLSEPSPATSMFRTLALSRTPVDRLEVEEYDPDLQSARLSWRRVEVPPYGAEESPLLYMIECETPGREGWRPLASGIPTTRYRLPDISPTDDYRFRVRALSPYGVSPPSYPTGLYRHPSPMRPLAQDLHIRNLEPGNFGLSWRSASVPPLKTGEPVSYQIEAQEYPTREWRSLATNIRDTSYRLGGLKPSSDYSFRVRAQTPLGLAEPTAPVTLTSMPVRPRLPVREPSISELGSDAVRLQWKPAELPYYSRHTTPITYTVDYQEIPGRDWVVAARSIPETSYTVRGLRGDRDYRFRICPETEYGPGEYSLPVHIHRRTVPSLPTREPLLSNISPTSATLSWHPATVASGAPARPVTYRIEGREPPASAWYDVAGRLSTNSYNLQFLYPDQEYMFRVVADYDGVDSEPTMGVYLPRRAGPPKMPREAPYVTNVQPESVILAWRSVELPSRITDYSPVTYRIEVQEGPHSEWRPLVRQINTTHFHATKLRPDIDYSFRVRAENDFGISDPTDAVLIRKRAVAPVLSQHEPLISDVRADSLRLTWQPAEMPSYLTDLVPVTYTVFMQEEGDPTWQPAARRVAGTSYYVAGLTPDRDYSFRVQAENSFGTSLPSFPSRLHRKLKGPIYSPVIEDADSTSFRLSWKQPALSKPTTYSVETLEPSTWKWRPLVSRLPHPSFKVTGIQPTKDYAFRVRAELDTGITEPSLPISFSSRRVTERAMTEQPSSHKALPTVPVERPTLSEVYDDSVRVNWHPTFYHASSRKHLPQYYRLEVREPPDTNWHTLVPRTDAWSYEVTDLKPNQDYAFRVRAVSDTGMSEPSWPVFHYRQSATPRIPLPSPEIADIGDDFINLRWKLVDIPAFDMDETPLSFMIEAQRFPEYDWRPVARGVTGSSHKVTGLEPRHDYQFRLRGETALGLTQPSVTVPVYRTPVRAGVPITNVRIDTDSNQPYSARLRWNPVYSPPYHANVNLTYTIEVQEPPRTDWYPIARDILGTSYTVPELSPLKDYLFRVKARVPGAEYSAPTPPVPYYRAPVSTWDRVLPPVVPVVEDYAPIARPYIEGLILKVPPRMSIEKPDMIVVNPECVQLTWKAARVPSATSNLSPTTYRVEVRHEDSFEWVEKAAGIKGLTTEIKGLNPYIDYAFRVRAVNDFGWSESTLPAFLHRPQDVRDAAADLEFEQYESYGTMYSDISVPRMPMDTPRMGLIQDGIMNLSWTPARIPAYARKTPISYVVEKKEPADHDWVPLASRLLDTSYSVRNILPKQDYLFRVRAENEHGLSDATLPAVLTRSKAPQFIRSSASRERELDTSSRRSSYSYIDSISSGVPPRVPAGRPSLADITDTSLTLTWQPGRMPSYIKGPVTINYVVEARQPPNHMWTKVSESVTGTRYKMAGLKPDQDYMFRVRAYNESGMSEPTLPVTLTRVKATAAEPRTMRKRSSVERFSSIERRASRERSMSMDRGSSVSSFLSRDVSRRDEDDAALAGRTLDTISTCPEFLPAGCSGVQYGIDGQPVKICLQLRGNPLPTVDWYFKGKKLLYGDRYDGYVTPSGLAVLEFAPLTWDDVGDYRCEAENEQGQATFVVKLQMSDPPTFLEPIRDLQLKSQGRGRFTCRVDGIPFPTVKFMKDGKPLTDTSRFKVTQDGVDQWSLHMEQAGPSLAGCYVCVAENAAGKVLSMARLSVDDDIPTDSVYYKKTFFEDDYYVLEELGRGRYSTVRRVIERLTGRQFAAKFTKVRDEADKDFFRLELDALLRQKSSYVEKLYDAYESPQQLILVVELAKDGDLLERVTTDKSWTESKAAQLVKLILMALRDVHSSGYVHLDVKPSNIRFTTSEDGSLQLIDFGFARKLPVSKDLIFNYGTPEFCSPESVSSEPVTPASDLWAVGVIAHLLLTGVSPFHAETTSEILSRIQSGRWSPDATLFANLTTSAADFVARLLAREPRDRLSLDASLGHDWLKVAEKTKLPVLDISPLRAFHERSKAQQETSAVKTVAKLVTLKRLLDGPVPVRGLQPVTDPQSGEVILPDTEEYGQFLDQESWYDWHSRHQLGLQGDLPSSRAQGLKRAAGSLDELAGDVELEPASQVRYQLSDTDRAAVPASLEKELEWMDETRRQRKTRDVDEISLASKRSSVASISTEGLPGPVFKEKLHDLAFGEGDTVILRCVIAGPPAPTVVWYKNEELLTEGTRLKMNLADDGEASLTIRNAKSYDAGIYKCVGRNKFGRVSNRMRLQLGEIPGRPGQPAVAQVSSTEALVLWEAPKSDGNSSILFYKLDYKAYGQDRWLTSCYTSQEAALATDLKPSTVYRFRVSATNRFATGHYSWASAETSTASEGSAHIVSDNFFDVTKLKSAQTSTRPALPTDVDDIIHEGEVTDEETEPKLNSASVDSVYNIGSALYKGKFYEEKSVTLPSDNDKKFVLRTVPSAVGLLEFNILKSLRHERLVRLFAGYTSVEFVYLVLEYVEGDHIARYLSERRKYSENTVACVIRQVLYALEYLQRCSLVHLNLQPASIMVSKLEGCEVKLTDFSLARSVSTPDGDVAPRRGYADFIPPEVVVRDVAGFPADLWGVGTLAFLLLSGVSPFHGDSYESTLVNIALNRYEAVDLYENITTDALKFVFKVLKRLPRNRPSLQDCLDHKWLHLTEQAIKDREDTIFLSNTLATFVDHYDTVRQSPHFLLSFEDEQLPVQMSTERKDADKQV